MLLQPIAECLTHGILFAPIPCYGFIFGPVSLVHMSDFGYKWTVKIGVSQQWAYWKQDLPHISRLVNFHISNIKTKQNFKGPSQSEKIGLEYKV
jgi:hypothetical protein